MNDRDSIDERDPVNERDAVLTRLAELPIPALDPELGARIRRLAQPRLLPRRVPPVFVLAVAASVLGYLGWALAFTAGLLVTR